MAGLMKKQLSKQTLLIILCVFSIFIGIGFFSAHLSLRSVQSEAVSHIPDIDAFHTTDEMTTEIFKEYGINIKLIPPDSNSRRNTLFWSTRTHSV